jgi:hypothetical protein
MQQAVWGTLRDKPAWDVYTVLGRQGCAANRKYDKKQRLTEMYSRICPRIGACPAGPPPQRAMGTTSGTAGNGPLHPSNAART